MPYSLPKKLPSLFTEKIEEIKYENNIKNTDDRASLFELILLITFDGSKIIFIPISISKILDDK